MSQPAQQPIDPLPNLVTHVKKEPGKQDDCIELGSLDELVSKKGTKGLHYDGFNYWFMTDKKNGNKKTQ